MKLSVYLMYICGISLQIPVASTVAEDRKIQFTAKVSPKVNVVKPNLIAPDDLVIEVYGNSNVRIGYGDFVSLLDSALTFEISVPEPVTNILLIFRSLKYQLYKRNISLSEKSRYDIGILRLKDTNHKISIVDIVPLPNLTFDFKLRNLDDKDAFVTEIRFLFYVGSGVFSECLPSSQNLYEFPFSAVFDNKKIDVADGDRLNENFDLPQELKDYTHNKMYISGGNKENPYLLTLPLKISETIGGGQTNSFAIKFLLDQNHIKLHSKDFCKWFEVYEAHAIISYNEGLKLVTSKFQVGYEPSSFALPSKINKQKD